MSEEPDLKRTYSDRRKSTDLYAAMLVLCGGERAINCISAAMSLVIHALLESSGGNLIVALNAADDLHEDMREQITKRLSN